MREKDTCYIPKAAKNLFGGVLPWLDVDCAEIVKIVL
jgi:hypothetical protein